MRLNDLDLNLLKTFSIVAKERSFTNAAKLLFIEQSAVSKAIKRLEDELGTILFLRTKRQVELTSKGVALLSIVQSILQSSEEFLDLAQDKERDLSGTLKFGAESPLSFLFMPQVIAQISELYPRLWTMMFTGITTDLIQRVKNRELEFAIVFYEGTRHTELEYLVVGQCDYRIVSAPKLSLEATNSFIGSREIQEQAAVLPTFEKLRKLNKALKVKYSANDLAAYKELVLKGLGIGLMPEIMVRQEIKERKLKTHYPDMKLRFSITVIHHKTYPMSLEARKMIEILKTSQL